MTMATLTRRGQTTIPKSIREQTGLRPGDRMHFTVLANGAIMLRVKRRDVAELQGILKPCRRLRTSSEPLMRTLAVRARSFPIRRSPTCTIR